MATLPRRASLAVGIAAALALPLESRAVRLDADGLGQALIFPYYTVQSVNGNALNTYLSIVNHTVDLKAVRVRFREGRTGAEVLSFNLFLSPNDVWTGALVPSSAGGTTLISADNSCTDPIFIPGSAPSLEFRNTAYSGANDDGAGSGLDRTREGYVEMIEMATLTGPAAAGAIHTRTGVPANCGVVLQANANLTAAAPSGGLSGGLTLINVANGMDFSLNATALAELSRTAFFRAASDPYPDFTVAEIDRVSAVVTGGILYRSTWARSVDAVSAVLMRSSLMGEYVLDNATASNTDFVVTFPTRRFYRTGSGFSSPFQGPAAWADNCAAVGQTGQIGFFNREEAGSVLGISDPSPVFVDTAAHFCGSVGVYGIGNGDAHTSPQSGTHVLGSLVHGLGNTTVPVFAGFEHGWIEESFPPLGTIFSSLVDSTRVDLATGSQTTGAHRYAGLPVLGFSARTFVNGTLTCGAGSCQGNYGGAFPFRYSRSITP